MARKKLWHEANLDFEAASRLTREALSPREHACLRRVFMGKYGIDEVYGSSKLIALQKGELGSAISPQIYAAIGRGLVWRIREALFEGRAKDAWRLTILLLRIASIWIKSRFRTDLIRQASDEK